MASFNSLRISEISNTTADAVCITFEVPEKLKEDYRFKAGQYVTLRTKIDGKEIRRDYSICKSPVENQLAVVVKRVYKGVFSNYANEELKVGNIIDVAPPRGRFTYDSSVENNTIIGFAAGSGITPIMGIIKTVLAASPVNKFILVYGNKSKEKTIFYNELSFLEKTYNNRLIVKYIFSETAYKNALFGRIDSGIVKYALKNQHISPQSALYYICGPESMIFNVKETLENLEVNEDAILFELFSSSENTTTNVPTTSIAENITELEVLIDDEKETLKIGQDTIILDALLENDIDAPYSCKGGVCSSCIGRITQGTAVMVKNNILTDSEIKEGLILSCQALATSKTLSIDFDDV